MSELEVEFISHATLKIRGDFGTLLCDPWFLNEPVYNLSTWKFPAAAVPPEEVARDVDYLYITHSHEDHFHIPSIDYIDRDVQVYLPAYNEHPAIRAQTVERVMRELGFHNIRKLHSWETIKLGGVTPFTVVPSAKTRDQDWENSGFVIEHPDCTLLNMNDNVNDEELCKDIKARWPKVDIGFIQSGGVTMFPGCFRMDEAEMRKAAQERKVAFRDQRRLMDFVTPKFIAPFAGDFCWLDDKYFHNNWANRTTLKLFWEMIEQDYAHTDTEVVVLYPSDTWTMSGGVKRNHPEIDWDDMLGEVAKVKEQLQPKVDAINNWLHEVDLEDLRARTQWRCNIIQKWMTKDYIDFTARFRLFIEGDKADFSFVMKANPEDGFAFDWNDQDPVQQTLYVPQHIWAAILEGKLMWNIVQWVGQADQHVAFTRDMGRFWFWLEYHVDLDSKNIQAVLDQKSHPDIENYIRPQYATFPQDWEWKSFKSKKRVA